MQWPDSLVPVLLNICRISNGSEHCPGRNKSHNFLVFNKRGKVVFTMTTKKQVLKLLRNNRSYLASEFNVKKIGIFGSYAKGSPGDSSDIDIIVEFNGPVGFKFMELTEYLESLLGKKVDVLTPAGLQGIRVPRVARSIEENILYV